MSTEHSTHDPRHKAERARRVSSFFDTAAKKCQRDPLTIRLAARKRFGDVDRFAWLDPRCQWRLKRIHHSLDDNRAVGGHCLLELRPALKGIVDAEPSASARLGELHEIDGR